MNLEVEKALKTALKIESDGARYYDMAATHSNHKGIKEIFRKFAEDERKHYKTILKYYEVYVEKGDWPERKFESEVNHDIHAMEKIFTKEFFEDLKSSSSELSAVSTGMLLEEESIKFYKERAEKETDIHAKEFYEELANIERKHHTLLAKIEKELLDRIWRHNKFSPL